MSVVVESLLATIENQRSGCEMAGSAMYAEILAAMAAEVRREGATQRILAPVADARFGDAVMLRFLAAVHEIVLAGDDPDLASHYPSAGGRPGPDMIADFFAAVARHESRISAGMSRGVQTNEVGRNVALLGGCLTLAGLGLPLRVLEVGSSGGLTLRFDRYRYEDDGFEFGPEDSSVRFVNPFVGDARPDATAPLVVAERRGCDVAPIDPGTKSGRLRLRSLVWPDQLERRRRLDHAIEQAEHFPVTIDEADAVSWLREQLARPRPGVVTVVMHSIMFQYLTPDDRTEMLALIDAAGERATDAAPFAWLRFEPGGPQAETRLTVYPGGVPRLLATSSYHGPPVAWVG